jgi:glycine oxidase
MMGRKMQQARTPGEDRCDKAPDVAVVGGGIIGSIIALRLAQRGSSVTVIDRGFPGDEASSAAAGILGAQLEARVPSPLLELTLASRALYPNLAAELHAATGIETGFERSGILMAALDEHEAVELEDKARWQTARGLVVERLSGPEARLREPALGAAVQAALELPDDGRVDARALTRACIRAAGAAGVRFVIAKEVRRVLVERGTATGLEIETERLAAGAVVISAGCRASLLEGTGLAPSAVRPVRGQIVSLAGPPSILRRIVAVHGRGYLVPRRGHSILAGSTMENAGFEKATTVEGVARILRFATTIVPWLGEARILDLWSGLRPDTADHLPLLGESTSVRRLVLATGHFRSGILLAPITGEVIADLLASGRSDRDLVPFSPGRLEQAAAS